VTRTPRISTVAVCMNATAAPIWTAWRARPPAPASDAAMMVLPWPGSSACTAPNPMASTRAHSRTGVETWVQVARRAKAPPVIPGRAPPARSAGRTGAEPLAPGANDSVAAVVSSGLDNNAVG
jgi:hypothetical protein